MSEVNEAALDSLEVAEADERPEVEPEDEGNVDPVPELNEDDLALESPEADTVQQKVEVRIDEDEYR
ncbi:hypothetical protein [Streptacidiphilus rugosus]|uniref:hypothetical protein n=1 Tax=Streptacidiphilus rugosus TaxID=405783 RepID=UPI00055C3DB7|nr:hypothetical protein [Streptacidiphilus rugosus]